MAAVFPKAWNNIDQVFRLNSCILMQFVLENIRKTNSEDVHYCSGFVMDY